MDAIAILERDHKALKKHFREFEKASTPRTQQQAAKEAFQELEAHADVEEEIFYPAFKSAARNEEDQEMVSEAVQEHHVARTLIEEMRALSPEDEQFSAKFTVLMESVEHHIEEEEREIFPRARKALGKQLEELEEPIARRKKALTAASAP